MKKPERLDNDLVQIYVDGYNRFGLDQAEKYYAEIDDCFQFLADNPLVFPERIEFSPPARIHHHGKHLIVYVLKDDHILIVRVLCDNVDLARHLQEMTNGS